MDNLRDALCTTLHERLGWPREAAAELAEYAHFVSYERNDTVFRGSEPSDLLHVLIRGEVRLYYGTAAGCRLLVSIIRDGDLLGIGDLQSGDAPSTQQEHGFTAYAAAHSSVAVVLRARVARALRQLPGTDLVRIYERVESRWRALCGRLVAFMTQGVRSRLASSIVQIARDFGIADARGTLIRLRLSHDDFAEMIGASRPTVSKCLNELAQAKVFVKQGGRYIVQRDDLLVALAADTRNPEPLSGLGSDLRRPAVHQPSARPLIASRLERGITGGGELAQVAFQSGLQPATAPPRRVQREKSAGSHHAQSRARKVA